MSTDQVLPRHRVESVMGELGPLTPERLEEAAARRVAPVPFVTISGEPGTGAKGVGRALTEALNAVDEGRWSCWDKELVDKVAAEHQLSAELIERLEEGRHTSLSEFVGRLLVGEKAGYVEETKVYDRLMKTVRALAAAGRTVIVGRGGVLITRHFAGGVHVRLVAPVEWRVKRAGEMMSLGRPEAEAWVKQSERQQQAYFHRHWPGASLGAELFTVVLNSAQVEEGEMVQVIRRIVVKK